MVLCRAPEDEILADRARSEALTLLTPDLDFAKIQDTRETATTASSYCV